MFLKMQAEEEARQKIANGAAGATDGKVVPVGAEPPRKETKAQRRQRLLAEARAKRDRFNPLDYNSERHVCVSVTVVDSLLLTMCLCVAERHKYTKRPFPKFQDMT